MEQSDLQTHVEILADRHDVIVNVSKFARPTADVILAKITIRPVRSLVTYYAALHELGHIVCDGGRTADLAMALMTDQRIPLPVPNVVVPRVVREHEAWLWAFDEALFDPTPAVWYMVHNSLTTYLASELARRECGDLVSLPDPDHPVFALIERASAHLVVA